MTSVRRFCAVSLVLAALAPFGAVHAQAELVGNWVLDSVTSAAVPPEMLPTVGALRITDAGGGKYALVSEATVAGVAGRSEVTFAIDGKDYTATSTPTPPGAPTVTQATERVSENVYKLLVKVDGQLIATALTELSSDGRTLTQTTTGIGQFAMLTSTAVYRRE